MLLDGKVAMISGASSGIGQAGAFVFAREGAKVIVIGHENVEGGQTIVSEIRKNGGEAFFIRGDMCIEDEVDRVVKEAAKFFGKINIFWHNVGGTVLGHLENTTGELFDEQITLNLKSAVLGAKYILPELRKTRSGVILFTGSMVGLRSNPYSSSYPLTYGLAKAAMVMLVRNLVTLCAQDNIRVNSICPGPVATPRSVAVRGARAEFEGVSVAKLLESSTSRVPLGREITTDEVAEVAAFLVSDKASGITGANIPIDGGFAAL